jgi:polyisoprenoid-binding protein YceI
VDGKNYTLTGNLTLHGVTKPVTLNVTFNGTVTNPMNHKTSAGFKVTGIIKRTDFGIGTGFPSNMVSDDVMLNANVEFVKS